MLPHDRAVPLPPWLIVLLVTSFLTVAGPLAIVLYRSGVLVERVEGIASRLEEQRADTKAAENQRRLDGERLTRLEVRFSTCMPRCK